MPRKRRQPQWDHSRCRCCGAPFARKHGCDCEQSKLIARVFTLFPGTEEITHEVLVVQRESGEGNQPVRNRATDEAVSGQDGAPKGNCPASVLATSWNADAKAYGKMTFGKAETSVAAKCTECDTIIARNDSGMSNEVFRVAIDHSKKAKHTVTVRQVSRIVIAP